MKDASGETDAGSDLRLLILAPSMDFGGGIERMGKSIEENWLGPVDRANLYLPDEVAVPEGNVRAKLRFVRRAVLAAFRQRPDTIMVLHVNLLPVAFAIRLLVGGRVAMFGIGVEVWAPFPWWMRRLISRCDRLLAISRFTAGWMARRAGIDRSRITVIPLPIEESLVETAQAVAAGASRPERAHVQLLTVTRLVPEHRYKGCFEIVNALPAVLARRPDVRWVLVGHGSDLPVIRERCRTLGVDHAVEFTGRIGDDQLAEQYRQADVFVLPSIADPESAPPIGEGFGLVYAEAAAFAVPSIASSAGGGSLEIVIDDETGVTVPPYDLQALVDAILQLVEDTDQRQRLGEGGRERVARQHLPHHFTMALRRGCGG